MAIEQSITPDQTIAQPLQRKPDQPAYPRTADRMKSLIAKIKRPFRLDEREQVNARLQAVIAHRNSNDEVL
jgi:hypothetical protein